MTVEEKLTTNEEKEEFLLKIKRLYDKVTETSQMNLENWRFWESDITPAIMKSDSDKIEQLVSDMKGCLEYISKMKMVGVVPEFGVEVSRDKCGVVLEGVRDASNVEREIYINCGDINKGNVYIDSIFSNITRIENGTNLVNIFDEQIIKLDISGLNMYKQEEYVIVEILKYLNDRFDENGREKEKGLIIYNDNCIENIGKVIIDWYNGLPELIDSSIWLWINCCNLYINYKGLKSGLIREKDNQRRNVNETLFKFRHGIYKKDIGNIFKVADKIIKGVGFSERDYNTFMNEEEQLAMKLKKINDEYLRKKWKVGGK